LESLETEAAISLQVAEYDELLALRTSADVERSTKDRVVKSVVSLDMEKKEKKERQSRIHHLSGSILINDLTERCSTVGISDRGGN